MIVSADTELSFTAYQERQLREISPAGLAARAGKVAASGKFRFQRGRWEPSAYPGHAVVSMVADGRENAALPAVLGQCQEMLLGAFPEPGVLYPLPAASFHQTIANTLSGERHQQHVVAPGRAADYPATVTSTFREFPPSPEPAPLAMRLVGLSIFGTAIGMLGLFNHEQDFQRVLRFREQFYGHPQVESFGIRRTRPFIGHVTLAYVESELDADGRARLVEVVASLNRSLALRVLPFHLHHAELRAYDHLAEFKALPGLPRYRL